MSKPRRRDGRVARRGGSPDPRATAFFTRAPICSSAAVSSLSANDVGHMAPSSRLVLVRMR